MNSAPDLTRAEAIAWLKAQTSFAMAEFTTDESTLLAIAAMLERDGAANDKFSKLDRECKKRGNQIIDLRKQLKRAREKQAPGGDHE